MEPVAVSAHQAAEMLNVSPDTVYRLVRNGHLPRVPHIDLVRIPVVAIHNFAQGVAA